MAGHSHWKQIKHKKEAADEQRGRLFSKLLNAVSIAARQEANPDFNPRLRTAIEKARAAGVPKENIERAISRSCYKNLEELRLGAYGPAGAALLIYAITDNRNRTIAEVKHILNASGGKLAEPGSVSWAFNPDKTAKFPQSVADEDRKKIQELIGELENHQDVQSVKTNVKIIL